MSVNDAFVPLPPEADAQVMAGRGSARTGLTGAAGEYHIAAELSRRGWLATVTIKNAPGTDVLAEDADTGHVITIQSKTSSGGDFLLSAGCEKPTKQTNAWYALVGLRRPDERPEFWLVPRNHVAALVYVGHRRWLSEPGRGGRTRKDTPMRGIARSQVTAYYEAWDTLRLPTTKVKYALPGWFPEWVGKFPLGDDHPDAKRLARLGPNSRTAQRRQ
jgi:hypothetical protein